MIEDYNYQGYKISNSHVRLGSKIHIRDFYYASRLFQNSYFANRFAILMTRYIKELVREKKVNHRKLIIVGYGKYSELLIVRIIKILELQNKQKDSIKVDYEIISDTEVPSLLRQYEFQKNDAVVLVIPIGSTLSTGIKMRNFLLTNKVLSNSNIIEPFINILLATDGQLDEKRVMKFENNQNDIFFQYGWRKIDRIDKIIKVNTLDNEDLNVDQKYFINLKSQWFNIHDCELCFPHDPVTKEADYLQEMPLIETDRTSVTPQLILSDNFGFSGDELNFNSGNDKIILNASYHYYGHQAYEGNEHFHFIKPNDFLEEHSAEIKIWLGQIKKEDVLFKAARKKVILLAPEGILNSSFTSLVNEIVFNNSANIIQYNTKNDFVQNFIELYLNAVHEAEYIFYLDDLVLTGKTFHSSNNFIKQCQDIKGGRADSKKNKRGFDAVIALITRADDFSLKHISRELKADADNKDNKIFSFKHIRIPALVNSHLECPVCKQSNLYKEIAERCGLNALRNIFFKRSISLRLKTKFTKKTIQGPLKYLSEVSIDCDAKHFDVEKAAEIMEKAQFFVDYQHLLKLIITDLLLHPDANQFFKAKSDFKDLINHVHLKLRDYKFHLVSHARCKEYLIKAITVPPFIYYKGIKEKVFRWIIEETDNFIKESILLSDQKISNNFSDYFYLKLLFKRLSLLKSNFLLRKRTLENLMYMYSSGEGITRLNKGRRAKMRRNFLVQLAEFLNSFSNETGDVRPIREILPDFSMKNFSEADICYMEERLKIPERRSQSKFIFELVPSIKYCIQAINNIDTINVTLAGYQYFIVACVKEIIHNNEAKAIKLEKNINELYKENRGLINKTGDFYHLLRILKMENMGIIKQFLERIQDEHKVKPLVHPLQEINLKYIADQNKVSNYLFKSVFDLITQENIFLNWNDKMETKCAFDSFISTYRDLLNVSAESDYVNLDTKVKSILNGVLDMLELSSSSAYISLSIQTRGNRAGIPDADSLYTFSNEHRLSVDVDKDSFIPTVFGGFTGDANSSRQTLLEFVIKDGEYVTLIDPLYNIEGNVLDKEILHKFKEFNLRDYNHLLYYRIADVSSLPDSPDVSDMVAGVVLIAVKGDWNINSWYFNCERLRYLLILQTQFIHFIKHNIENDGFRAFIEETTKLSYLTTYRHGFNNYINEIRKKVKKIKGNGEIKKLIDTLLELLFQQMRLPKELFEIQSIPHLVDRLDALITAKYIKKVITARNLESMLKENVRFIYSLDTARPNKTPDRRFSGFDNVDREFVIYDPIFSIVIYEIILNILKYSTTEYESNYIDFSISEEESYFYLIVKNPFGEYSQKSYTEQYSEGKGVKMILHIYQRIFGFRELTIGPQTDNTFIVKLPLMVAT